jgi:hypothetical protein
VCFVDLLAPWLVQLSPLNHDWQLTADHQRHLVEALLKDERALERLVANAEQLQAAVLRAAATGDKQLEAQLAAYAGLLAELLIRRRYDEEQMQAACWSLILGITATFAALPLNTAGNLAVGGGSTVASTFLPFDPERAASDEFYVQSTHTLTIALIAHQVFMAWLAAARCLLARRHRQAPTPASAARLLQRAPVVAASLPGGDTGASPTSRRGDPAGYSLRRGDEVGRS